MNDKNYHLDCVEDLDVSHNHQLTGKGDTFLKEKFAQDHSACFQAAVVSLARAREVPLATKEQPWICSACMLSDPDHMMMSSTIGAGG